MRPTRPARTDDAPERGSPGPKRLLSTILTSIIKPRCERPDLPVASYHGHSYYDGGPFHQQKYEQFEPPPQRMAALTSPGAYDHYDDLINIMESLRYHNLNRDLPPIPPSAREDEEDVMSNSDANTAVVDQGTNDRLQGRTMDDQNLKLLKDVGVNVIRANRPAPSRGHARNRSDVSSDSETTWVDRSKKASATPSTDSDKKPIRTDAPRRSRHRRRVRNGSVASDSSSGPDPPSTERSTRSSALSDHGYISSSSAVTDDHTVVATPTTATSKQSILSMRSTSRSRGPSSGRSTPPLPALVIDTTAAQAHESGDAGSPHSPPPTPPSAQEPAHLMIGGRPRFPTGTRPTTEIIVHAPVSSPGCPRRFRAEVDAYLPSSSDHHEGGGWKG
ncbi:hypothetical protein HK101_003294, partial [Irineochytrium annulatum]